MTELDLVLDVIVLFFVRIGIPLILLVALGTIIDRWQTRQHEVARREHEQKQA